MNGCTWVIGGQFTADGQTLNATASWVLTVTGTAVASGTGSVKYSNASGGTRIKAGVGPWTDGENNSNWDFIGVISNLRIGGTILGWEPNIQLLPDKNVKILI